MKNAPLSMAELRAALKIRDRAVAREDYLRPCIQGNLVELTLPRARKSPLQKYRLSAAGRAFAEKSLGMGVQPKNVEATQQEIRETTQETTQENDIVAMLGMRSVKNASRLRDTQQEAVFRCGLQTTLGLVDCQLTLRYSKF